MALIGALAVVLAISFSALIFTGQLSDNLGQGATLMLTGGMVLGIGGAFASSIRGAVLGTQDAPAIILALAAAAIAGGWQAGSTADLFSTVAMLLAVSTLVFGATLLFLGRFQLGALVRYLPYPVIGGFMAATGWFLFMGALGTMTGSASFQQTLTFIMDGGQVLTWAPGLAVGLLLVLFSRLTQSVLALPVVIACAFASLYIALAIGGKSFAWAGEQGLLLGPFPEIRWRDALPTATAPNADWSAIAAQTPLILAAVAMGIVGMLLNLTGVELATGRVADVDRDLRRTGLVNMASGALGGGSGYIFIGLTLLSRNFGVLERSACLAAGLFCGFTLLAGPSLFGAFPLYVFGGITVYLGADLLYQWLWVERQRLPVLDFAIVMVILLVAATIGFLEGIVAGLAVSVVIFVHSCIGAPLVRRSFSNSVGFSAVERPTSDLELLEERGRETRIYQLQGVLFFGTIYKLAKLIAEDIANAEQPVRRVIVDFEHIQDLDTSAIQGIAKVISDCRRADVDVWLCGLGRLSDQRQADIISHLADVSPTAYLSLEESLEHAEELTLKRHRLPDPDPDPAQPVDLPFENAEGLGEITEFFEHRLVQDGEALIVQGDASNDIFFVRRGSFSVEIEYGNDQRVRVSVHFAGSMIGEMALYTGGPRSAHVVAIGECEVLRLTLDNLERMEREAPQMAVQLHRYIAGQTAARLRRSNGLVRLLKG